MSKIRKSLTQPHPQSPAGAASPPPPADGDHDHAPLPPPAATNPPLSTGDLMGLRVSFARDVMMQSINAALSRSNFVGVDLPAAASFSVLAADALVSALTAKAAE